MTTESATEERVLCFNGPDTKNSIEDMRFKESDILLVEGLCAMSDLEIAANPTKIVIHFQGRIYTFGVKHVLLFRPVQMRFKEIFRLEAEYKLVEGF